MAMLERSVKMLMMVRTLSFVVFKSMVSSEQGFLITSLSDRNENFSSRELELDKRLMFILSLATTPTSHFHFQNVICNQTRALLVLNSFTIPQKLHARVQFTNKI